MWDNIIGFDVLNSIMDRYNNDDILQGFSYATDIINVEGFYDYGENLYINEMFDKKEHLIT